MAATEIIMLGALVLGGAIFIKVLPQLQQAQAGGGATPAPAAAGGQGVWTQTPGTSPCDANLLNTACPTIGATGGTSGWCTCSASASAAAPASSAAAPAATGCAAVTIGSGNCPCCLANNTCKNNSSCSCSGTPCATQTHASSTANKPGGTAGTTGQQARAAAAAARGHVNPTRQPKPNSPGNSCVNHVCPLQ